MQPHTANARASAVGVNTAPVITYLAFQSILYSEEPFEHAWLLPREVGDEGEKKHGKQQVER